MLLGGASANGWGENGLIRRGATSRPGCAEQPGAGFLVLEPCPCVGGRDSRAPLRG